MRIFLSTLLTTIIVCAATPAFAALQGQDTDGDGIPDLEEDTNHDGILDPGETNAFNADTDNGGESDGAEVAAKRNPNDLSDDLTFDADGDGLINGVEILRRTDPKNTDTDGDGLFDGVDAFPLDSKFAKDENTNGLPDEWETKTGLDQNPATATKVDDPDGDGLTNAEEFARGSDPLETDSDRDGVDDKTEIENGGNPKENACLSDVPSDEIFSDTEGHWAENIIGNLRSIVILPDEIPLIRGYPEGKVFAFRPDQSVTRYEFLKMVLLSNCMKLRGKTDDEKVVFTDIPAESSPDESPDAAFRRKVIYTAVHEDIVDGYEDGTFRPDNLVNRAEALKILSLAARLDGTEPGAGTSTFYDVTDTDWFSSYVSAAAARGIVGGYGDGTFRAGSFITRAEAAKIVYLTMLQNPWINGYVLPNE